MHKTPRVVGLDLSLTSTGVAWSHRRETTRITTKRRKELPHGGIHERLELITVEVQRAAAGCDFAVIENPSYRSTSNTFHQLAGGWWHATQGVWRAGVPYTLVAPSTLKKFATGNGGKATDKKAMVTAAREAFPDIAIPNHDTADAMWAAALGSALLGRPLARTTTARLEVMNQIELPPTLPARRLRRAA